METKELDRLVSYYIKRWQLGYGVNIDLQGYTDEEKQYIIGQVETVINSSRRSV